MAENLIFKTNVLSPTVLGYYKDPMLPDKVLMKLSFKTSFHLVLQF